MLWGSESKVTERFASAGVAASQVSFRKETYEFNFAGTPAEFANTFLTYYGPTMNALDAATAAGKGDNFRHEMVSLFNSCNTSKQPNLTTIPATFLLVTVQL